MKNILILIAIAFVLTACKNEETVSIDSYEQSEQIRKELREKVVNLENELEQKEYIPYTEAGIEVKDFEKPESEEDYFYAEMSEEEFNYRMDNTKKWLNEEFNYYFERYKDIENTYLDKEKEDFKDDIEFDKLNRESSLLSFDLEDKCQTLFTDEILAGNLNDRVFMNNVSSSCDSLANGFKFLTQYDAGRASTIDSFFETSETNYEKALKYYNEEVK